jgi:DNA-binding NarL/FixJ family response regulator
MKQINLFIVDDHSLVIAGIHNLLKPYEEEFRITGEFLTGRALLEGLKEATPDVLLLDVILPDINGKELALIVKKQYPALKIIALTSLDAPVHVKSMMRNGCDGYLLKNTSQEILCHAIRTVHQGGQYIEQNLEKQMLHSFLNFKNNQKQEIRNAQNTKLTKREKEILSLIVKENSNQDIADMLCVSVRTIEFHRQNLQLKLDIKTPMGLLKAAIEMGLI